MLEVLPSLFPETKKQSADARVTKNFQDRGLDYARPISAPHFPAI